MKIFPKLRSTLYALRFTKLASCLPHLILVLMIIIYALYFSWYTINRHNTLNSYAADLSLIDQPMWNTVLGPGGFMELTWDDRQQPRLAEHFEPILVPLALLFFGWDDVRVLLIAQSIALALGALPVYWIARSQLTTFTRPPNPPANPSPFTIPTWSALVFAGVYLLSPHLQAANIADFHADPFVVTPLLFAFWYASQKRWGWMWLWALVAMATKETLPTLTAMLGVWLGWRGLTLTRKKKTAISGRSETTHGLALISISSLWFLAATFLIVAPLARQYFGTDGPIYFAHRYQGGLAGLPALLQDPNRWQYVGGLLASTGFLPLLAPDLLLLGLPVLLANLLSNFPGQFSGEQHYSAPLVAGLMVAAIYGARRLIRWTPAGRENGQTLKTSALLATLLWLTGWSLGYHALHGWTPLSLRVETYRPTWASASLPAYAAQIPPEAVVSASAAIHPHLAHRRIIYLFPTLQQAEYVLVDVTDIPGVHPNDARSQLLQMLTTGWQLLAASDGLILAQKTAQPLSSSTLILPNEFYNFVRTTRSPKQPTPLTFGDGELQLLGYDLHDDPDDGVIFRFYWQALKPLPDGLRLWPLVYDDLGRLLSDPAQVPMIASLWYPPAAWQPRSEIIVTETLPQLLPDMFHLGLAVGPEGSLTEPALRYPVTNKVPQTVLLQPGRWVQLASFQRRGPLLNHLPVTPTLQPLTPVDVQFGPDIHLTGLWFEQQAVRRGDTVPLLLRWSATASPLTDYTVFVHLLAPDGSLAAQNDAFPTWLTTRPTSGWPVGQPVLDSHYVELPVDLEPGPYLLQLGLYETPTLERLPRANGEDSFVVGQIMVR